VVAAVFAVSVVMSGCDLGPSGPGTVSGTVTGSPSLGAVVLDISWPGVVGFEARGSTLLYSSAVPGSPDRYRVIVVNLTGGDIPFAISVEDAYLQSPVLSVVEATGTDNHPYPVSDLRVVLER